MVGYMGEMTKVLERFTLWHEDLELMGMQDYSDTLESTFSES